MTFSLRHVSKYCSSLLEPDWYLRIAILHKIKVREREKLKQRKNKKGQRQTQNVFDPNIIYIECLLKYQIFGKGVIKSPENCIDFFVKIINLTTVTSEGEHFFQIFFQTFLNVFTKYNVLKKSFVVPKNSVKNVLNLFFTTSTRPLIPLRFKELKESHCSFVLCP